MSNTPNPENQTGIEPAKDNFVDDRGASRFLYLSDAWLAAANSAVSDLEPLESELIVGMHVVDGPEGDRSYHMTLGAGPVGIGPGLDNAGVTMTMKWSLAVAIAKGLKGAQRSFLDGEIQLGGDAGQLLGHQKQLADLDDRLAKVRSRTDFAD